MLKATEAPAGIQGQTGSEEPPDTLIRYVSQVVDEEPYQSFLPGPARAYSLILTPEALRIARPGGFKGWPRQVCRIVRQESPMRGSCEAAR
jgi:hypothetical protein